MASNASSVLFPAKFLLIILQILALIMLFYTKTDNIKSGISLNASTDSQEFKDANVSITVCLILSLVTLSIELLFVFWSVTLFYDLGNMIQCFWHGIGAVSYTHLTLPTIYSV
eukprot:TRINITY_DN1966_c0_g1_i6.p1 TRINITY_DN1966_c0_g1~~TRINITY_DN1966_c0_g1_i6.p1  ORF type:complete len:113 (+),score=8.40 TRINITY_DN1966_c0_g1_i6:51-389(+)